MIAPAKPKAEAKVDPNSLTLTVDGKALTGWSAVEVTLGIEQMPNTFVITATEKNPVLKDAAGIKEGSPCTVALGKDKVITGYVDTINPTISAGAHAVRLIGRGKCQDLVDCSAEWKGCQVSGANALEIATKLAAPYGIKVKALSKPGPVVPQFNINVSDTPAAILEQVCRHAGLLYYEDREGNLVLSEVTPDTAASGFEQGKNVEQAGLVKSISQRFSKYRCSLLSVDTSGLFEYSDGLFFFEAEDPYVSRHRQLVIVAEGVMGGLDLAKKRALWEASRRAGRCRTVELVCDSWRDKDGKLWTPNTLAPLKLPGLTLPEALYCISQVTFRQDLEGGTTASVTLMPSESFEPEPIVLQPLLPGVERVNP